MGTWSSAKSKPKFSILMDEAAFRVDRRAGARSDDDRVVSATHPPTNNTTRAIIVIELTSNEARYVGNEGGLGKPRTVAPGTGDDPKKLHDIVSL